MRDAQSYALQVVRCLWSENSDMYCVHTHAPVVCLSVSHSMAVPREHVWLDVAGDAAGHCDTAAASRNKCEGPHVLSVIPCCSGQ